MTDPVTDPTPINGAGLRATVRLPGGPTVTTASANGGRRASSNGRTAKSAGSTGASAGRTAKSTGRTGAPAGGAAASAGRTTKSPARGRAATKAPSPPVAKAPSPAAKAASPPVAAPELDPWDRRVIDVLAFLRRRLIGQYQVDEFGFDRELTELILHPPLRLLYRRYFRVECSGIDHIPRTGPALVVANHSGTVPLDSLMLSMAVHDETPNRRHLRLLGADLVFRVPVLSELARKGGATLACHPDVERLLRMGELVGVFPEGFKGIGKPYRDRYKLQRFGRGGFVSAALRNGTPIVPAAIVGAEEIYPMVASIRSAAKFIGLPYLPVTPLFPWLGPLGLLPLPSKWLISFGEPIDTSDYAGDADDPMAVFNLSDQVRETIQTNLHALLQRRPDPFG